MDQGQEQDSSFWVTEITLVRKESAHPSMMAVGVMRSGQILELF